METSVPVRVETTVELRLGETPIGVYVQQFRQAIQRLRPEEGL